MTSLPISTPRLSVRPVLAAAVAYPAAWIAGLAVPVPAVAVDASAAATAAKLAGHEGQAVVRSLLVHGVAALALAVVVLALASRTGRATRVAGLAAAGLSLVQCVLGVADPAGMLDVVNVVDGVKMVALAAFAGLAVRDAGLPRWLRAAGIALVAALAVSAVGYAFLLPGPAAAAFVSLPLLLVFVTGAGVWRARA